MKKKLEIIPQIQSSDMEQGKSTHTQPPHVDGKREKAASAAVTQNFNFHGGTNVQIGNENVMHVNDKKKFDKETKPNVKYVFGND